MSKYGWITSLNKKKHQRAMNALVRDMNKNIATDDLWRGRFYVRQIYAPQWYIYNDRSGAELFVHLKFYDKKTGRTYLYADNVNGWRHCNGWRLWEKMNWFIVEYCDAWKNDDPRKDKTDYNKIIIKN